VLPLGGDCFSQTEKSFNKVHLLYVGTLQQRNIIQSVKGFHKYVKNNDVKENPEIFYTIIGDAKGNELQEIRDYISCNHLEKYIEATGYVHYNDLYKYFDRANIGVSYIPQTKYFDNQPPTKTYEYLVSGLPVIATRTKENIKILNDKSGVLIDDNADSFAAGLQKIIEKRNLFQSKTIRNLYRENCWENIMNNNLKNYVEKLIQ
jgi:glycosyltransferase involved in cell wall biosynthesis